MRRLLQIIVIILITGTLTSCKQIFQASNPVPSTTPEPQKTLVPSPTPSPTTVPPKTLAICMKKEPSSLFYYANQTQAAKQIYQAIYDGPIDFMNYRPVPVILERIPSMDNGDITLIPVDVEKGDEIVDDAGNLVTLDEGVRYRPSGCTDSECAIDYDGSEAVKIDELQVAYHLLPGLKWSDGTPLTAADSVFSYRVARQLFKGTTWKQLYFLNRYTAEDNLTVIWTGIPGFQGVQPGRFFFSPLPEHILGTLSAGSLPDAEQAARKPVGWGAYKIQEWTSGDHISLEKNPLYFRAAEGYPAFDYLVYRFIPDTGQAIKALEIGECDILDSSYGFESVDLTSGKFSKPENVAMHVMLGAAWEQITFDIQPLSPERIPYFARAEVRKAFGMCIDRQALIHSLGYPAEALPDTYFPKNHPYAADDIASIPFSPEDAGALLDAAGWKDDDANPSTPRRAVQVPGVPDGTPFEVTYLVPDDDVHRMVAKEIAGMEEACGIRVNVKTLPWNELLKAGPDGAVFGRKFDAAQFAWALMDGQGCRLFLRDEIPGEFPEHARGWGGGNASGFDNPDFDEACMAAGNLLENTVAFRMAQEDAQNIFVEEVPSFPLYLGAEYLLSRGDLCGLEPLQFGDTWLDNLELIETGKKCAGKE